jgi:hypothetical protein
MDCITQRISSRDVVTFSEPSRYQFDTGVETVQFETCNAFATQRPRICRTRLDSASSEILRCPGQKHVAKCARTSLDVPNEAHNSEVAVQNPDRRTKAINQPRGQTTRGVEACAI